MGEERIVQTHCRDNKKHQIARFRKSGRLLL